MRRFSDYPAVGTYSQKAGRNLAPPKKRGPRKTVGLVEIGSDKSHQRLLQQEALLFTQMLEQKANNEQALYSVTHGQWTRLAIAIGTSEMRDIKNQLHRGELVPLARVRKEYGIVISTLAETLRAGLKERWTQVDSALEPAKWDRAVDDMIDDFFRQVPEELIEQVTALVNVA
jgi:hypothetical protein